MKKQFIAFSFAAFILLMSSSCKKTESESPTTTPMSKDKNNAHESGGNIHNVSGILIFRHQANFESTIESLESHQREAVAAFSAQFDSITNDSVVNATAIAQGYNENQTYIDFENGLSFHSLRKDFDDMLTEWGHNGLNENDNRNPFTYYNAHSYSFLTILNPKGEVGIEGKLYRVMRNGVVYEVTNGDRATLDMITEANMDVAFTASNVVMYNSDLLGTRTKNKTGKTATTCLFNANVITYLNYNFYPAGNQHIQDAVEVHFYSFYSYAQTWAINWQETNSHSNVFNRCFTNFSCGHKEDDNDCTKITGALIGEIGVTSNAIHWQKYDHWIDSHWFGSSMTVQVPNYRTNTNLWHPNISPATNHYETYLQ